MRGERVGQLKHGERSFISLLRDDNLLSTVWVMGKDQWNVQGIEDGVSMHSIVWQENEANYIARKTFTYHIFLFANREMPHNTIGVYPVQLVYGIAKISFVLNERNLDREKNSLEASHSIEKHIEDLQERLTKSHLHGIRSLK
ncbi:hypothetical protein CEXT_6691 [Caerostris extrusa]|uniref:Uncharacterized protein n=1 Tax=Caerostris extrusa TaxID=172846 RepID=A0AAV4RF91_CAEEX|nr:hypothetical protein CEXT_6691 [Caerostris extrusa]